ncbi:PREDICTED: uncharacterized protein LOC107187663 [Dufourea novaeangliae]|uniref:uncharacterized protein LOC107187663 n=1 Tax=Dufourea novaeangliae TaxID=178035 RepID=UPI0007671F58|nr:PREDICTED: uncharacterized protein LOC107187663 [Dufourea novaeangliae]
MSLSSSSSQSDSHFPSYIKEHVGNYVSVYWYDEEFSQSRYPPGQKISKACTLICLLVAQRITEKGLLIYDVETSPEITNHIAEAMVEGNATHAWIVKNGLVSHPYLSTEEALRLGGQSLSILQEWTFEVFYERIERGLHQHISNFLSKWYASPKSQNLFMLLITCGRTVLFIFQEKTYMVTFFDSHSHNTITRANRGLVIAQTTIDKLQLLCKWYIEDILNKCYNMKADQYELAFLYPKDTECCGCGSSCTCGNHCKMHNNNPIR